MFDPEEKKIKSDKVIKNTSGYLGTPIAKKLGIKDNFKIKLVNQPDYYFELIQNLPENFLQKEKSPKDFIHYFIKEKAGLIKDLPKLKKEIEPNGMIWISWPKKASKIKTDVTEDVVREIALKNGLVDVKVCAIDEIWSGLKLVIPLKKQVIDLNKFQNINFKSIDDFFEYLPENELKIVNHLRQIILESIPDCKEKLSYNVPYYYRHSRICFIWPASIPWGNVKMNGVQLGFCNGSKLRDDIIYLDKGNRKQVYSKVFRNTKDINPDLLKSYIFEAVMIDEKITLSKK